MRLALIPPFCHLEDTKMTDYQLMLPHLVAHPEYEKTYMELCADPDQYVILDNGVAEGKQVEFKEILIIGARFGVNEIVLPDVMGDMLGTMHAASRAIHIHGMHYPMHYMYVLQGQTFQEVMTSASFALKFSSVRTLGIPRHLITTLNDPGARWKVAWELMSSFDMHNRDIHFLGMNPTEPRELAQPQSKIIRRAIRGVDTSAPYNFAYYASSMSGPERVECKRPKKYFEQDPANFHLGMVYQNIEYLKECVR